MSLLLKDPGANVDYAIDWARDYLNGETIVSSSWRAAPGGVGALTIGAAGQSGGVAKVSIAGGIAGRVYRLTNDIVTSAGRQDARSIIIRVEAR